MKVNIYDVAKKAGVSVVTVSRVINNSKTVRENNRKKVEEAMKELNYHPSAAARSLARGKTGVIGLIIPSLTDCFLSRTVQSINDSLEKEGYFLAISVITEKDSKNIKNKIPYLFQEDRVDGMIIMSSINESEYICELKSKNIPFVLMDNQGYYPSIPSIAIDNYSGGYDATKHLIELGHTSIVHICGPNQYLSSRERCRGYCDALKNVGIEPCIINSDEFSIKEGYNIAKNIIAQGNIPTAIFAADDYIALGAINALNELGFKVPQDVSIVGYDDQQFSSQLHPLLTTVRQPAKDIGEKGVDILIKIIKGKLKRFNIVKLKPKLIIRGSTSR